MDAVTFMTQESAVVILRNVGDNFAASMTGGMAFVYDAKQFENYVNPQTVVWQIQTDY